MSEALKRSLFVLRHSFRIVQSQNNKSKHCAKGSKYHNDHNDNTDKFAIEWFNCRLSGSFCALSMVLQRSFCRSTGIWVPSGKTHWPNRLSRYMKCPVAMSKIPNQNIHSYTYPPFAQFNRSAQAKQLIVRQHRTISVTITPAVHSSTRPYRN